MRHSRKKGKQQTRIFYSLAFLIPSLVIMALLAIKGIYWGSNRTILASDGFHQYVIFNTALRNILHGNGHFFYTFTSGLGLNFYALTSYYLGSLLSPLTYFFSLKSMPESLYLLTLMKFGLIGLSSFYSLHKIYKDLDKGLVLLLSTCFSLMSFAVSQLEINMWLDVFIWAPLVLLGLNRLIHNQGMSLYYFSLIILFIQNYYFGYMFAIFIAFWYLLQISWDFKLYSKSFPRFFIVSILAGVTSLIMILPAILDLKAHGENFSTLTRLQTENSWWLDIFAKNLIGAYDTTKFGAIPMIYAGLLPLMLTVAFFTVRSIKFTVKLSYFLFLSFFILSFYLEPLDLFWQGMHSPNMFLHRYAWLFSLFLIHTSAQVLSHFKKLQLASISFSFVICLLGFGLTYYFRNYYDFLQPTHFLLTVEFLIAYLFIWGIFAKGYLAEKSFTLALLIFTVFELGLNAHYYITGLDNEWHFPSRESYERQMDDMVKLVDSAKEGESHFYRLERWLPQTGNDSMKYSYNGISQFSSIRNTSSSQLLDRLGFKSSGTNLNLRYQNNTLLMDMLFGVSYNIAEQMPHKYGFDRVDFSGQLSLYRNVNSSQLAILSHSPYKDIKLTHLSLDNQKNLINQLTGLELDYFDTLDVLTDQGQILTDNNLTVQKEPDISVSEFPNKTFRFKTKVDSQVYISLPKLSLSNNDDKDIQILVNQHDLYSYTIDNSFAFFDLGYFSANQEVTFKMIFPNQESVSFEAPKFYALSINHFQQAANQLKRYMPMTQIHGNQIITSYDSPTKTSLIYTIPYDQGWSAKLNGQSVPLEPFQNGFMVLTVPKGKGQVILTFVPRGFYLGVVCFVLGLSLFLLYQHYHMRKSRSA